MRSREWKTEVNNLHKSYSNEIKKLDNKLNRKDETIKRLRSKLSNSKDTKRFPNGFTSWYETHHEIVAHITRRTNRMLSGKNRMSGIIAERYDVQGTGGLYELAEELTDRFELINKGRQWDGEFFDELEEFLTNELK